MVQIWHKDLPDLSFTLLPTGVMALHPPANAAAEQVTKVEERSPIEIFLSGLQSTGSWKGFLSYAALAGVIVWIGLYTNTIYLLVAAMLLAPFAGPAMNTALATARGDLQLLRQSILRYFAALSVTIAVTALLSWMLQQQYATNLMLDGSQISSVAVLIPLAAGAAGALSLIQSDRSSLVSGAATGMLVAASLAPPAGIVGMGAAIGRWDLVVRANIPGQETLLCVVYVQRSSNITRSTEKIRADLTQAIQTRLLQQGFNATPLVAVTVLETPASE